MSDRRPGKCFVDTNILVYAHDRSAGIKHQRAQQLVEELWNSERGVLSTQVLQELCINLYRKSIRPRPLEDLRLLIQDYLGWEIVVNTAQSVLHALDIQFRYKISFWDALIVQAAENSGAEVLYSEDLNVGQKYGFIRVVNPFAERIPTRTEP